MSETKQCPMCSEEVLATAKKCKHCTSDLVKPQFKIGLLDGFFAILCVCNLGVSVPVLIINLAAHSKDRNFIPVFILLGGSACALFLFLLIRAIRKSSFEQKWAYLN